MDPEGSNHSEEEIPGCERRIQNDSALGRAAMRTIGAFHQLRQLKIKERI